MTLVYTLWSDGAVGSSTLRAAQFLFHSCCGLGSGHYGPCGTNGVLGWAHTMDFNPAQRGCVECGLLGNWSPAHGTVCPECREVLERRASGDLRCEHRNQHGKYDCQQTGRTYHKGAVYSVVRCEAHIGQ